MTHTVVEDWPELDLARLSDLVWKVNATASAVDGRYYPPGTLLFESFSWESCLRLHDRRAFYRVTCRLGPAGYWGSVRRRRVFYPVAEGACA